MTSIDRVAPLPATEPAMPFAGRIAPMLFATTLFVSALLLFAVQPMFTKMVLPKLGGAPSVWSVAMVAFQAFLFIAFHRIGSEGDNNWLVVLFSAYDTRRLQTICFRHLHIH